ncbi:MAG: hypothetical protein ACRESJ_11930, partial [Pseudomonas sp.]|uniref:hypothetical protein n=1 Tax=Pseudomonas sp. TaxID=306 RepID=UPI003D6FC228
LLTLLLKIKFKRSQPSAAPTGVVNRFKIWNLLKGGGVHSPATTTRQGAETSASQPDEAALTAR